MSSSGREAASGEAVRGETVSGEAPELSASLATRGPMHSLLGIRIEAVGAALPSHAVRNEDLVSLGCDPDWIVRRTGIQQRYHAAEGTGTSDLAYAAAQDCLSQASVSAAEIDLILVATATPDTPIPSTACHLQRMLGATAPAMDINAACSGFVYALVTAAQFLKTGASRRVLVVGADMMSRTVDPRDVKTYPLFGDGAGAVLLSVGESHQGLLSYTLGADGAGADLLVIRAGGYRQPLCTATLEDGQRYLKMAGQPVFKWAVRLVADSIRDVVRHANLTMQDVDLVLLHQANERIMSAAIESLEIPAERAVMNIQRVGNTSAASIPLALAEAHQAGRIQPGQRVLMCGFGAGLTWGTALFQW